MTSYSLCSLIISSSSMLPNGKYPKYNRKSVNFCKPFLSPPHAAPPLRKMSKLKKKENALQKKHLDWGKSPLPVICRRRCRRRRRPFLMNSFNRQNWLIQPNCRYFWISNVILTSFVLVFGAYSWKWLILHLHEQYLNIIQIWQSPIHKSFRSGLSINLE